MKLKKMKRAYRIQIDLSKWFSKEEQTDFLKKTFERREIEFICKPKDENLNFLFYSDGEDDLQKIFKIISKSQFNFKKIEIRKLTLKQKKHFHPNVKNSIAFTPEEVKFEKINSDDNSHLGITDDNELISVKFEDIQLPGKVYKYRSWEIAVHKRVLTNSELYFAPPSSFGDHRECNLPLRHDLVTPFLRRKWLTNSSKEMNPNFSKKKHKKFVDEWIKKSPYNDLEHRKQVEIDHKKKLDESLGILSLTPDGNNPEMWEVFGNNHKGICVGFDSRKLFDSDTAFAHGGPVEYYHPGNSPIIMPFYLNSKGRIKASHTNVFSLSNCWEYEKEYRISKLYLENRAVKFNKEAIVEVIIGSEMPQENKEEVLEIIRNEFPNIDIYESIKNQNGEYELSKIENSSEQGV